MKQPTSTQPAQKKSAPKTAKTAKVARGHAYEITDKGKKTLLKEDLGGQQKVVLSALIKLAPATVSKVSQAIGKTLKTKSSPQAIVGFYFAQWKRDGLLRFAAAK